jgi:Zn ribbon nucleic-acid-binding protein
MKDIIGNCPLCEERALHVAGTEEAQVMQCINCGYTTSTKFTGTKETNEEFQKLGEDMKNWAVEKMVRFGFRVLSHYQLVCCIL